MDDHLQLAKNSTRVHGDSVTTEISVQLAQAHALIALVERLDTTNEHLHDAQCYLEITAHVAKAWWTGEMSDPYLEQMQEPV